MTVAEALRDATVRLAAAGIAPEEARVEARILAAFALALTPEALRAHPEDTVSAAPIETLREAIARRARREPLAYITGTREFYGLTFRVTPAVLIPRPETEFLVEAILKACRDREAPRIVDVGTGSGCVAVAVAANAPRARLYATDLSEAALAIAQENAARHEVAARVRFERGDLLSPVAALGPFDVIASNPPYIAPAEIESLQPEVRDWEPRIALGLNNDPLHFYRRLAAEAPPLLVQGGFLAVEVGQGQAEAVASFWRDARFGDIDVIADYAGIPRVVIGRLTG